MLTARSLQRRLNLEVLVQAAPAPAWVAAASFAAWKFLIGFGLPVAGALCVLGVVAALLVLFRRRRWTEAQALVALDRAAGAGGLALSLAEVPSTAWEPELAARMSQARPPPLALRRPLFATFAALLFAGVAVAVPRPQALIPPVQAAAESHVQDAEAKAEVLRTEQPLDPVLQAELERLAEEARSGSFDAADWAALDAVNGELEQAAAERAGELAQAEAAANQLASALEAGAGGEAEARAREQLESALMDLGTQGSEGQKGEGEQGEQGERGDKGEQGQAGARPSNASKQGKPGENGQDKAGAAKAKELAKALAERRQAMEKAAGQGSRWAQGKGTSQGEGMGPKGFVHDHRSYAEGGDGTGGMAAPSRGPGAAPVTFGPQHPIDPDQLEELGLDRQGKGDDPMDLQGVRRAAPKPGEPGAGGTLGVPAAGASGVVPESAPLAPRHRDLVKRYFDRQAPAGDKR